MTTHSGPQRCLPEVLALDLVGEVALFLPSCGSIGLAYWMFLSGDVYNQYMTGKSGVNKAKQGREREADI